MRRDPRDLEIQNRLLREGQNFVPSPTLHASWERGILAHYRTAVEEYHAVRGSRNATAYNPKAAQLKYEVPYYNESLRLNPATTASFIRYPKLEPTITLPTFLRKLFRILCAPWLQTYMPLSFANFQLHRI